MSKAYGKELWNNLDESAREDLVKNGARVRFLKKEKSVMIEMYGDYKFKVPFVIFQEMLLYDKIHGKQKIYLSDDITNFYTEKVKVDWSSEYEKLLKIDKTFPIDSYEEVSLLQFKYRLEPGMLNVIKRQHHKRKLGRTDTAWVQLKPRILKGGRKNYLHIESEEDRERMKYLKENYDKILENILKRDSYINYCELEKELHPGIHESDMRKKYKELKKEFYAI